MGKDTYELKAKQTTDIQYTDIVCPLCHEKHGLQYEYILKLVCRKEHKGERLFMELVCKNCGALFSLEYKSDYKSVREFVHAYSPYRAPRPGYKE